MCLVAELPDWLVNGGFAGNRCLHLVASTLLVGGVLFFAFVVPRSTKDLNVENQLAVFGYARWIFRKIVLWNLLAIVLTGVLSSWRMWYIYRLDQAAIEGLWARPNTWAIGHVIFAILGAAVLIRVTATRRILGQPVRWLWTVSVLFLISIMLASVARQMRLVIDDRLKPERIAIQAR